MHMSIHTSFSGELEIIDDKKLRSLELCITGKNTKRKKTSSKSNNVKPLALSKVIDIHKVYLALRQAHRDGDNKYVPDPVVLFRSNPFRPGKRQKYLLYTYLCLFQLVQVLKKNNMITVLID